MHSRGWAGAVALLLVAFAGRADDPKAAKPPIRGLVSMGAYRFVGKGGDPVNTLEPLRAKPDCRKTLGVRCVFDNHNLDSELPKPLAPIYALLKKLGPEIVFQTYRTNPADFEGTIRMGVAHGATSIELWQDHRGFPLVPDAQLRRWAELVEANRTP